MNWKNKHNRTQNKEQVNRKFFFSLVTLLLFAVSVFSQSQEVPMADGMRAEGKIYVVVAIVLVILFGLMGYLVFIDRKVTKLEKELLK